MVNKVAMPSESPVRVEKPVYGGSFTSEAGLLAFVLPGELVQVDPLRVIEASPKRVEAGCVHFGACGGCQYQHASYTAQILLKSQILSGILAEAGIAGLPEIRVHQAAEWQYRNRIRLRVEPDAGGFRAGYSRRASNEFLPIHMCPIAAPLLWRAAETLLRVGGDDALCRRWLALVSEMELFCSGDETRLQVQFFLREPARDAASFAGFCERLRGELPELAGAGAELDPELNRRVRRRWAGISWGADGLNYEAAGRSYWVSRGAFFQVNRFLVGPLVELVCCESAGTLAWDLFAGVGLFTRALSERFERVIAVESGEIAAADLLAAGKGGKGRPAFEAVRSSTLDFLRAHELQRERPDLIVLDPPRAGLGAEAAAVLARIASPRLVYVSCDPVTLARDLAILTRSVYRIESMDLVDLFPQTFHMEDS